MPAQPNYAAQAANQAAGYAMPRPGYTGGPLEPWLEAQLRADPSYQLPRGYKTDDTGHVVRDTHSLLDDILEKYLPMAGFAAAGGIGAANVLGAGGGAGASAASAGELPVATEGVGSALPGTAVAGGSNLLPGASSGGGGFLGTLGKLNKAGINPTQLILGGMSLLGKDPQNFQERHSFAGTSADPVQTLTTALSAIRNMGDVIATTNAPKFRSSVVPEGPAPVTIPGIPFQIGGGMGRDPALKDPTLLEGSLPSNPFSGSGMAKPGSPSPRRRT